MFGIHGCKGYFPHYFNTPENSNYIGPYPAADTYGCDQMKPGEREDFLEWHKNKVDTNAVFDMRKEEELYCIEDVRILREGLMMYQDLIIRGKKL